MAGHPGITNTLRAMLHDYWWPVCKQFVTAYVRGCSTCQSTKPNTTWPKAPIYLITTEEVVPPFHTISLDLITDLPLSNGFDLILTVVDHSCSKAAIFLPCTKTIGTNGIAKLYAERIFPFYGLLGRIISDRDT